MWLTYKVVNTYRNHINENNAILAVGLLTNVAVIVTAVAAFPWVRNTHHKLVPRPPLPLVIGGSCIIHSVFERHHRFVGWTALFLTCKADRFSQPWVPG